MHSYFSKKRSAFDIENAGSVRIVISWFKWPIEVGREYFPIVKANKLEREYFEYLK